MRTRVAAAIGALALLVAVLAVLLESRSRLAYENAKLVKSPAVLLPGRSFCQPNEYVPANADSLRVWVSTAGKPGSPFDVELVKDGRVVARGGRAGGYVDTPVYLKLRTPARETADAEVCFHNRGPRRIGVMGSKAGPNEAPVRAGAVAQPQVTRSGESVARGAKLLGVPTVVRLEWHRQGRESWLALAPTLAERAGLAKASFIGSWSMWSAFALVVLAGTGGVVLVLRQSESG